VSAQEIRVGINSSGEIKLPAEAYRALGVKPGESIVVVIENEAVSLRALHGQVESPFRRPTADELDEQDRLAHARGKVLMDRVAKGEATSEDFKEMEDIARDEHVRDVLRKLLAE